MCYNGKVGLSSSKRAVKSTLETIDGYEKAERRYAARSARSGQIEAGSWAG